eukprot:9300073-Prorocentrum_lima.AAC.1
MHAADDSEPKLVLTRSTIWRDAAWELLKIHASRIWMLRRESSHATMMAVDIKPSTPQQNRGRS